MSNERHGARPEASSADVIQHIVVTGRSAAGPATRTVTRCLRPTRVVDYYIIIIIIDLVVVVVIAVVVVVVAVVMVVPVGCRLVECHAAGADKRSQGITDLRTDVRIAQIHTDRLLRRQQQQQKQQQQQQQLLLLLLLAQI